MLQLVLLPIVAMQVLEYDVSLTTLIIFGM